MGKGIQALECLENGPGQFYTRDVETLHAVNPE